MQILPMLFKSNSSGALLQWQVWADGNKIVTEHGQIGGAIQRTEDVIRVGKNLGRANATSPEEQALAEAQSKWEKQVTKKGYVEDRTRAAAEETDLQGEECMLAHTYGTLERQENSPEIFVADQNHKITFPCAVQPKLDGHRCRVRSDKTLWSRGHRQILQMPHIEAGVKSLFSGEAPKLDGELYNHALKEDFEKLTSILKQQKKVHPEHELIKYYVYDIDEPGLDYLDRLELLKEIMLSQPEPGVFVLVETRIAENHEDVLKAFKEFESLGYEGAIVRNLKGVYEGKRSYNLQKLKGFYEKEFKILGIKEGKGKMMGHAATFTCQTEDGQEFEVTPEGANSKKKEWFENHSLWEGKLLTVRFKRWTKKGIPYGLTGLRIREDL